MKREPDGHFHHVTTKAWPAAVQTRLKQHCHPYLLLHLLNLLLLLRLLRLRGEGQIRPAVRSLFRRQSCKKMKLLEFVLRRVEIIVIQGRYSFIANQRVTIHLKDTFSLSLIWLFLDLL